MQISQIYIFILLFYIFILQFYLRVCFPCEYLYNMIWTGADPAFVIRGGPNSEHLLPNLRKLLKSGEFFLITQSLIVKRN